MGRTLPSATQVYLHEEQSFSRFRRALRRSDQLALDDLFTAARQHTAAAQYASHALPFEVFLLAMLLEEHKEVMRLREWVEAMKVFLSSPPGVETAAPWIDPAGDPGEDTAMQDTAMQDSSAQDAAVQDAAAQGAEVQDTAAHGGP